MNYALGRRDQSPPGTVHCAIHEQLVADPEGEIRRLLDFIDVPFGEACLRSMKRGDP